MKLKLIKKQRTPRGGAPAISFNKSGYLSLNPAAVDRFGFKVGQGVGIFQDEEKPKDFYLISSDVPDLPKLRANTNSRSLITGYSDAKATILKAFGLEEQNLKIPLGGQVKTDYGSAICLITAKLSEKGGANG